mmetsp:Transcript_62093/g.183511  ORF Transcript_62093/g.183511 Transcript_62093/m.183511 type:complete len:221 (-) Transcript_62093:1369-2031(-)
MSGQSSLPSQNVPKKSNPPHAHIFRPALRLLLLALAALLLHLLIRTSLLPVPRLRLGRFAPTPAPAHLLLYHLPDGASDPEQDQEGHEHGQLVEVLSPVLRPESVQEGVMRVRDEAGDSSPQRHGQEGEDDPPAGGEGMIVDEFPRDVLDLSSASAASQRHVGVDRVRVVGSLGVRVVMDDGEANAGGDLERIEVLDVREEDLSSSSPGGGGRAFPVRHD